jgi:hypothetical protein
VAKLLIILLVSGALADGLARSHAQPPMLIDPAPATGSLDVNN